MNWQAIGIVAEIVSAVAVVISLVYLAIQIRQTRQQASTDNLQSTVDRWVGALISAMRSEEDADFLRHALHNYDELSVPQMARLHAFMMDLVAPFQAIHTKHESGLIDPRLWETIRTNMAGWFRCPGMLALWQQSKSAYPPYLVEEIDAAIEAHEGRPFTETLPYLRLDE
jgi:hypothetical protein